MCQQNLLCNHASSSPPNGGGNCGGCGNNHCKVTAVTMTTTMTADANADADAHSSSSSCCSSSCCSSSGATARGGEYQHPRTSAAPALAALAGSKGPATAAMKIGAALSPPQVSVAGDPTGRRFPPSSPPSPPRDRLLRGGSAPGGPAARCGVGLKRGNQG
jgi:hypothetical protein